MASHFEYGFHKGAAWHGMGTVVDECVTVQEALRLSGLDWEVKLEDMYYRGPANPETGKSSPLLVPNAKALVKQSGDRKILGIHTERYEPIQNTVAFDVINHIVEDGANFSTAAALKDEKVIYVTAELPEKYKVLGDEFGQYFFFATSHDGSMAFQGGVTNVRMVCWNTLQWGIKQRLGENPMRKIRHTKNAKQAIEVATKMWKDAVDSKIKIAAEAERLVALKFSGHKYESMVNELFPIDEADMSKRQKTTVQEQRSMFWRAITKDDLANFNSTGWQFVQAAADYADHAKPSKITKTWREARVLSTISGAPLVRKAIAMVNSYGN